MLSTRAMDGPWRHASIIAATAGSLPMSSVSTLPSWRLRTQPRRPRRRASAQVQARKPTPWTRPVMTRWTALWAIAASGEFENDLIDGEAVAGLGADRLHLAVALGA